MAADGIIDLSLDFNAQDAEHAVSNLAKNIVKAFDKAGGINPLATLESDIKTTEKNLDELDRKLTALEQKRGPEIGKDYAGSIQEAEDALARFRAQSEAGAESMGQDAWNSLIDSIEQTEISLEELQAKQQDSTAYNVMSSQYSEQENQLEALKQKYQELRDEQNKTTTSTETNSKSFGTSLKHVLSYAIGIRSLFSLFSKLRSAAKDGIGYLIEASPTMKKSVDNINKSFNMMKAAIGGAMQGIIIAMEPVILKIAQLVTTVFNAISKIIAVITGKSVRLASTNLSDYNKTLSKTGTTAKKTRNELAGFDDLNVLQQPDEDTGADIGVGGAEMFGEEYDPSKAEGFYAVVAKIANFLRDFKKNIKEFWDSLDTPEKVGLVVLALGLLALAIWAITKGTTKSSKPLKTFADTLGKLVTLAGVIGIMWMLNEVIQSITELIKVFADSGLSLWEVIGLLVAVFGSIVLAALALKAIFDDISLKSIAGLLVVLGGLALVLQTTANLIEAMAQGGYEWTDILGVMLTLVGSLVVLMGAVAVLGPLMSAGLGPMAILLGEIIVFLGALALLLPPILEAVGNFVEQTGPVFIEILNDIYDGICRVIEAIGKGLPPVIKALIGFIEELGNIIIDIMDEIQESLILTFSVFQAIANGIISVVESLVNIAIKAINWLIDAINQISFDVPDWVPIIGGRSFGFNLGHVSEVALGRIPDLVIPKLAQGAVLPPNKPFMAMLGDQREGTNIEAPLDTIVAAMERALGNIGGVGQGATMTLDGQVFARLSLPYILNELNRRGYNVKVLD